MTHVALAEDHVIFRQSFKQFIEQQCAAIVLYDAGNGKELLDCLETSLQLPDIIITDIEMPVMDGRRFSVLIREKYPAIKLLVLSQYSHEDIIIEMFHYGVHAFLTKNIEQATFLKAIDIVENDQYFIYDGLKESIYTQSQLQKKLNTGRHYHLTNKQIDFLKLCATDLTYKEIAHKMKVSPRTVDCYRDTLLHKYNVNSRTGLVVYAIQSGIISV